MYPVERFFTTTTPLPSIPGVVQSLICSLSDEDVELGVLIKQIARDPSLSARVLRLANSSHYGVSRKIGAIDDAVTLIGLNALRTLVIASGITAAFKTVPGVDLDHFWRHATLSAQIARKLGRSMQCNAEFAYTAALMHRIGQLLISLAYPSTAREIAEENRDLSVNELAAIEREHLGFDHCELGAEMARRWQFPAVIHNAMRWYGRPLAAEACPYAGIVHLAAHIAFGIEAHTYDRDIVASLNWPLIEHLVLEQHDWFEEVELARNNEQQMLAAA
ncbi:HDOD domain-containing protein [Uliginosibacterium sediminicola]|uniref:HDOD domain-containing protein n=1 Tax=Uliginosibacterium sediminicola TaxID=2024550 RepID=A0ABU9Z1G7_9RHOO